MSYPTPLAWDLTPHFYSSPPDHHRHPDTSTSSTSSSLTIRPNPPPSYQDSLPDSLSTFACSEEDLMRLHRSRHSEGSSTVRPSPVAAPATADQVHPCDRANPTLPRLTSVLSLHDAEVTPSPTIHENSWSPVPYPFPLQPLPPLGVAPAPVPVPIAFHPAAAQPPLAAMVAGSAHAPLRSFPSTSSVSSVSTAATAPPLTYPFPTIDALLLSAPTLETCPDLDRLAWAQDVLRILERLKPSDPVSAGRGSSRPIPATLKSLLQEAVPIIESFATHRDQALVSKAAYLEATLLSSGAYQEGVPKDPKLAFKRFEAAARGGEVRGWFRLGRDYESVGDVQRAKDCFWRGKANADGECTYRLGMAYLLGQLDMAPDPELAIPLLQTAADLATIDAPHMAYVWGMLLANEIEAPVPIPENLLLPPVPTCDALTRQHQRAKEAIERAAYLGHAPAQYKMGYIHEHAALACAYDPLMSVQWYSLASQGREVEADMALSKWFLCGAEGHFAKNEELARTFAEKAARKAHPNGCFAMGYYYELGIGGRKDMDAAIKWYQKAAKLDNADAISRLAALDNPSPAPMSMAQHQANLQGTLVRKRTAAKIRSDRTSTHRPADQVALRRKQEEYLRAQADNAAKEAARASQSSSGPEGNPVFSPAPRPGEFMTTPTGYPSPRLGQGQSYTQYRPHLPMRQTAPPGAAPVPMMSPNLGRSPVMMSPRPMSAPTAALGQVAAISLPSRRDAGPLRENRAAVNVPEDREMRRERMRELERQNGPQTFAEMGFVSKPVADEGCVVM